MSSTLLRSSIVPDVQRHAWIPFSPRNVGSFGAEFNQGVSCEQQKSKTIGIIGFRVPALHEDLLVALLRIKRSYRFLVRLIAPKNAGKHLVWNTGISHYCHQAVCSG